MVLAATCEPARRLNDLGDVYRRLIRLGRFGKS